MYCDELYCILFYSIKLYFTLMHCVLQYCTIFNSILLYIISMFSTLLYSFDVHFISLIMNSQRFHSNVKNHLIIGQLPRVSGKDPERKEWTQLLKRSFCVLCMWANFLIFLFQPSLFIQYSTEECSTVQVFIWCLDTIA